MLCIFPPVIIKLQCLQHSQGWISQCGQKCVIGINLPECHCCCLSICINSTTKLQEKMLFRANDASNSNRPSRLLMDFNSSYYSIIVFSQQLFVDTILRLQDLSVQSQEMARLFIYNHLVPPTNKCCFICIWRP